MIPKTAFFVELKQTLKLAFPICLSQVGQMAFGILDSIMVGRLGAHVLAASALVGAIMGFVMVFGMGIGMASSVLVARAKASGQDRLCGEILLNALGVHLVVGLGMFLTLELVAFLLPFMNQDRRVVVEAIPFLRVNAVGMIPFMLFLAFRQYSEGLSRATFPTAILVIGLSINAFLNWLLIYGNWGFPQWGLVGAGVGTLLARTLMLFAIVIAIFRFRFFIPFRPSSTSQFSFSRSKEILSLGLPSGVQYFFEVSAFSLATVMMGWFGAKIQAAHSVALSVVSTTFMVALGTASASAVRVGHYMGLKDIRRVRLVGFGSWLFIATFMITSGTLIYNYRLGIPKLFIDDLEVIELAAPLFFYAALFQVFDGVQGVTISLLRGVQDKVFPTVLTLFGSLGLTIPLSYFFAFRWGFGYQGIWLGLFCGLSVIAAALVSRFLFVTARIAAGGSTEQV